MKTKFKFISVWLWYTLTSFFNLKVVAAREFHTKQIRGYYLVNRKMYNERKFNWNMVLKTGYCVAKDGTHKTEYSHPLAGAQYQPL